MTKLLCTSLKRGLLDRAAYIVLGTDQRVMV